MGNPNPSPATRFKPGHAPLPGGGRPKKKPLTEALQRLCDGLVGAEEADEILAQHPGKQIADVAARGLMLQAIRGDATAFREIADRVEGKVPQGVDVTSDGQALAYLIEPNRPQTREEWLAAYTESQQAIANADQGIVDEVTN